MATLVIFQQRFPLVQLVRHLWTRAFVGMKAAFAMIDLYREGGQEHFGLPSLTLPRQRYAGKPCDSEVIQCISRPESKSQLSNSSNGRRIYHCFLLSQKRLTVLINAHSQPFLTTYKEKVCSVL